METLRRPLEKGNPDCGAAYIALLQRYRASYMEYQAALLHVCSFLNQERLLLKNTRRHTELPDALITTGYRTSAEAEAAVADYADKLSECWAFIDKNRTDHYLRTVEDLIDQNFSDSAFGVTQIAEHLHLTPSYASKLYKDATGSTSSTACPPSVRKQRSTCCRKLKFPCRTSTVWPGTAATTISIGFSVNATVSRRWNTETKKRQGIKHET